MHSIVGTFWPAFLVALAGLCAVALWRGGRALLAALVEIARLPTLVEALLEEIRGLVLRVSALEDLLPEQLRVHADLTLTNQRSTS